MPDAALPNLSRLLPAMASAATQQNWTGSSGLPLLMQTVSFVRSVAYNYARLTGRPLDRANILDFGCGYGRIARLMYFFTDPSRVIGVDPLSQSIALCREAGLGDNFLLSDYLPHDLPVGDKRFDLIYAFSVFTHTSRRATRHALDTLRDYVKESGLAVITIRPVEFWSGYSDQSAALAAEHRSTGFAFAPHGLAPVDGDVTYGDTSISLNYLTTEFPNWQIAATDRSLEDPLQIFVFLRPK